MKQIPLEEVNKKRQAEIKAIYFDSFPAEERRQWSAHLRAMENPLFHCNTYWEEDGQVSGLLFFWQTDSFCYIEHLAVSAALRNQKRGEKILQGFLSENRPLTVLEIEPPENTLTKRRQSFYERQNFFFNAYPYLHASYFQSPHPHPLFVMSYGRALSLEEFTAFQSFMKKFPMQYIGS